MPSMNIDIDTFVASPDKVLELSLGQLHMISFFIGLKGGDKWLMPLGIIQSLWDWGSYLILSVLYRIISQIKKGLAVLNEGVEW